MTSATLSTTERNGDSPKLALVTPLGEEDERAARIIARAIELSGLIEKFDELINELRGRVPPVQPKTPSRQTKPNVSVLEGKYLYLLEKFFFGEYDSYEALLRITWPKEVDKNPLGTLKQRFGARLRSATSTVAKVLSDWPEQRALLPRNQVEFYDKLVLLLEREERTLDEAINYRREITAQRTAPAPIVPEVERSSPTNGDNQIPPERDANLPMLSTREVQTLKLLAAGHSDEEAARDLGIQKGSIAVYVSTAKAKLGARDRQHVLEIFQKGGWVENPAGYRPPTGRSAPSAIPDLTTKPTDPGSSGDNSQTDTASPQVQTRRSTSDQIIERRVETNDEGREITRVTLAPSVPPAGPRPRPVAVDEDRGLHSSQFNLGTSVRIVEALYLGSETYLGDIFPILYRGEVRDRNQAIQRWRELYQRVDQPRKRFLALMKAVYRDPNNVGQFPPNERAVISRVLERYPAYRDLEIHDQNLNRARSKPAAPRKSTVERPYEIAELDIEILRAALAQTGEQKPSLNLIVVTRRCRRPLPTETVERLLQPALDQLREAQAKLLDGHLVGDESQGLLLNIEMAFFGVNGKLGWTVDEVIQLARDHDAAEKRDSVKVH